MTITTTLNRIREHSPCAEGWTKLLRHLGKTQADDEPLPFSVIVASNGLDDALWCCRAEPQHAKEWRLFAVWCARQVQHLMTDPRSIAALDVAERFANGEATQDELAVVQLTACVATCVARDSWLSWATYQKAVTVSAASAAEAAAPRAPDARGAAASAVCALRDAAAVSAGGDVGTANWGHSDAARQEAMSAARDAQRARFLEIVQ